MYFRVTAENEHGIGVPSETKQAVKISEAPSTPERIEITDIMDTSCTVEWSRPEHDGGTPITGYIIEYALKENRTAWTVAATTKNLYLAVDKLITNKEYVFRVRAQVGRTVDHVRAESPCRLPLDYLHVDYLYLDLYHPEIDLLKFVSGCGKPHWPRKIRLFGKFHC